MNDRLESVPGEEVPLGAPQQRASPRLLGAFSQRLGWGPLFRKYVALFLAVVSVALLSNGLFEIWFSYREYRAALIRIQREQAEAAAGKISQFIKEIESQIGWTTQLPWSAGTIEQRRFDGLRLLRQVPAITELSQLDATGKEQLRVSQLAMDVVASQSDYSKDPKFAEAVARKVYYGPVYFRRESEPYMTLSLAGARRDAGVSVAEVNLKLIWDVVTQIKVGERGHAYVINAQGRLVAHPDISLVLRNTDMSSLAQVQAARAAKTDDAAAARDEIQEATDVRGGKVLTAYAPVSRSAGWSSSSCRSMKPMRRSTNRSGVRRLSCSAACFSRSCPACFWRDGWSFPFRRCAKGRPRSAAATSPSASRSRQETNWKGWRTSSTTWRGGCRTPTPTSKTRSRRAPTSLPSRSRSFARSERSARPSTRRSIWKAC